MNKEDFINQVVMGWMKGDLIRMRDSIRPDKSEIGNINFPLALCVMAYMEYLGSFLLGGKNNFTDNVTEYIQSCFQFPQEYPVKILRDVIRNGLAHEYFVRGAVSRNGKRPAIYKGRTQDVVLDAETLVNDFIFSLDTFAVKLSEERYTKRMHEALNTIDHYKAIYKDFIDSLGGQPDDNEQATPSSGPSVSPGSVNSTTLPYEKNDSDNYRRDKESNPDTGVTGFYEPKNK